MELLWGKGVEGASDAVMLEVAECEVFDRDVVAGKEVFVVWGANGCFCPLPPMNSWSHCMHYLLAYFLTDLFVK